MRRLMPDNEPWDFIFYFLGCRSKTITAIREAVYAKSAGLGLGATAQPNVRWGSKAPVTTGSPDVCLSPDSGGIADAPNRRLGPKS
jgi:hypothetical protein